MLRSRSSDECHLYMDLNPCQCGEIDFEPQHWVEQSGHQLVACFVGTCRGCGTARSFHFALEQEMPPPPPAFGGDSPSRIIDPGQFLWVAEELAAWASADPADRADESEDGVVEAITTAVAAVEEALKFIPAGADAVPEEAFNAPESWLRYQRDPSRFHRDRLLDVLEEYRVAHARCIAAVGREGGTADAPPGTGIPGHVASPPSSNHVSQALPPERVGRAAVASPTTVDFEPANEVERELGAASRRGDTDGYLMALLLAEVFVPTAHELAARDADAGWRETGRDDERSIPVFTSRARLYERFGEVRFRSEILLTLILDWPDPVLALSVNPGTPIGASLPGSAVRELAVWATEMGLTEVLSGLRRWRLLRDRGRGTS